MSEAEYSPERSTSLDAEKKRFYDFLEKDDVNDETTLRRLMGNLTLHGKEKPSKEIVGKIVEFYRLNKIDDLNDEATLRRVMDDLALHIKPKPPKEKINTLPEEPLEDK